MFVLPEKNCPSPSIETIEVVRIIFKWSLRKSIGRAIRELQMSPTTIQRVISQRMHMTPYRQHLLQHLKDTDKPAFFLKDI